MPSPETHAVLSASSAYQWLNCPRSVRFEQEHGKPDEGSVFAEEGTEAHALAETELSYRLGHITKRQYQARMRKRRESEYHDEEMVGYVDDYVQFVQGLVQVEEDAAGSRPIVELEQRVDFSEYVPEGFGTSDVVIISDKELHIVDLKYGKGIEVEAEGNPQLRLYALGAVERYRQLYDIDRVITTIVQPRLPSLSTADMRLDDLVRWGTDYVRPRALMAWNGEGEFNPSEKTCRWCRAKDVCKARADAALKAACEDFSADAVPAPEEAAAALDDRDPNLMTDEDIARALAVAPILEDWCKSVREHALAKAKDGTRYPGWKLVEGRSTRKIADPDAAIAALEAADVPAEDYLKPYELQGITALTKSLGKKRFEEILGGLVVKPAGKPVLVTEDDKRPEIGSAASAAADFGE